MIKNELKFYFSIFLRRLHYFLAVAIIFAAGSVALSRILPPVYMASARLLVESAQIPDELAAATINTETTAELQIIQERLLTRAYMLDIARRFEVFEDIDQMTADEIVEAMRAKTEITQRSGRSQATFMTIGFEADQATVAANVVNEYVTFALKDNVESRTERASETYAFFQQEVERLSGELAEQSARIVQYKNENSDALPETLEYRLNQQSQLQQRLATFEREVASLEDQKRRLAQIFEATGRVRTVSERQLSPDEVQLVRLEEELVNALGIYSSENPKIKLLEAQIERLKIGLRSEGTGSTPEGETISLLDLQLDEIDGKIDLLQAQSELIKVQLADLDASLERTSGVSITIGTLNRDYENIQFQYNNAVDRLAKAATGERIELLSKGQRIAVLDAATVPTKPSKPNRKLIAAGGTAMGIAAGLALVVLLELLNGAIRRPSEITRAIGITPIATIPYVRTPMELVVRRATITSIFLIIAIGVPALLFAIHTFYLPLDLIFDRVAGKVGAVL